MEGINTDTIGSEIIRQKPDRAMVAKIKKAQPNSSKKLQQKNNKSGTRKRRQDFGGGVESDDENSDNIEYDDSDNNAAVAGADEADSVGDADDSVGEIPGLQATHQVSRNKPPFISLSYPTKKLFKRDQYFLFV